MKHQQSEFQKISSMMNELMRNYSESIGKLTFSKPKINTLPSFPFYEIPDDFFEELFLDCQSNAKYGWCLSSQMDIPT